MVAAGDCTVLRLHRIVFHDLSRDYPEMLMELCKLLARRLRRAEDRSAQLIWREGCEGALQGGRRPPVAVS